MAYQQMRIEDAEFQMPTLDLLRDYGNEEISINRDELEENKNKIVGLLKNFSMLELLKLKQP